MARALKCDRCGKLYEYPKVDPIKELVNRVGDQICVQSRRYKLFMDQIGEVFDLCPECENSLVNWFTFGKQEDDHA